jgi:hypothetical protein
MLPAIFTIATDGYAPFVLNLHASMQRVGLGEALQVYCLDDAVYGELHEAGLSVHRAVGERAPEWSDYGTRGFATTMRYKYLVALDLMAGGRDVLYVDSDIVFLKDPLSYLARVAGDGDAHLVLQYEFPNDAFNAGFWWARATPSVRALFDTLASALDTPDFTCDQIVLNRLLREQSVVQYKALDAELFAAGNQFLEGVTIADGGLHVDRSHTRFPLESAYMLHFNFLIGKRQKVAAMLRMGVAFHASMKRLAWQQRLRAPLDALQRVWHNLGPTA